MKSGVLAGGGKPIAELGASRIIRWTYCLFIFSICFENLDFGLVEILGSISKILGVILIVLVVLVVYIKGLHIRRPPAAFVCFASFLAFLTVSGLLHDQNYFSRTLTTILYPLLQLIIFFYITYNILHDSAMIGTTAAAIALSCTLLAALQRSGVELPSVEVRLDGTVRRGDEKRGGPPRAGMVERESAMNTNPNGYGGEMCIGFVCLLWLRDKAREADRRVAAMACMAVAGGVIAPVIVRTGSRGAVLALVASISTFIFISVNILAVIKRLVASLVLLAAIALLLPGDAIWNITDRWDKTFASGDMAGREDVYPAAWGMFLERPLFGWGPLINMAELGARLHYPDGDYRDPHNVALRILTEAGIVGAAPFIAGFYICHSAACAPAKGLMVSSRWA